MRSRQKLFGWLVVALAALCCGALLLLPGAYTTRAGEKLFEGFYTRPSIAGMLDEDAQELPIAYALYQKRYLGEDPAYLDFEAEIMAQAEHSGDELWMLKNALFELSDAGMIHMETADYITQTLEQGKPGVAGRPESAGFYRISLADTQWMDSTGSYTAAEILLHEQTGKIVEFKLEGFAVIEDAEQLLAAYIPYLGVDALTDWKASPSNTESKALFWSPKGQLYLYCACNADTFIFGALSLPDEEVEKFF